MVLSGCDVALSSGSTVLEIGHKKSDMYKPRAHHN